MKNHKIDNMITTRSSKTKFINNVHANDVKTIGLPADTVTKVIKSNPILYSAYDDLIVSDIDGKFQSVRLGLIVYSFVDTIDRVPLIF